MNFQKGDWVRFMSGGVLVIGEVAYIKPAIVGRPELVTDIGTIFAESVLEHRVGVRDVTVIVATPVGEDNTPDGRYNS